MRITRRAALAALLTVPAAAVVPAVLDVLAGVSAAAVPPAGGQSPSGSLAAARPAPRAFIGLL